MTDLTYHRMRPAASERAGGIHEQIRGTVSRMMRADVQALQSLNSKHFPETPPALGDLRLESSARLTDVLSMNYLRERVGLLVSPRLRAILEDVTIHAGRFYEATVFEGETGHPYWLLYLLHCGGLIRYDASTFIEKAVTGTAEPRPAEVRSYEQWRAGPPSRGDDEIYAYKGQRLVLQEPVDVLRVPLSIYVYVSDPLKQKLESLGYTGIEFHPPERGVSFHV